MVRRLFARFRGLHGHMLTDSRSTEPYGGKTSGIKAQGESIALEDCQGWPFLEYLEIFSVKSQYERVVRLCTVPLPLLPPS